jgi:hypothetical protein
MNIQHNYDYGSTYQQSLQVNGGRTLQRPMKSPYTSFSYPPGLQPLTAAGAVAT